MTFAQCLTAMLTALAVANISFAQLPSNTGNAFNEKIFQASGQAPPVDPSSTLTGDAPPPPRKIWSGSVDAGLTGQQGNTDVLNIHAGMALNRKVDDNYFTTNFNYNLAKQEGIKTQNQAFWNSRDEILFPGSPWSLFASSNVEWDEFKSYDFLVGVYGGIGYTVIDDGNTLFKLRSGAGAVRRYGGPDSKWIPEALSGFDFHYKFTAQQSFVSSLDYYPRLDKWGQYRIRARAAYEIIIDPTSGMALRLGAQTRYDSDPGNAKRNDLNYFASLAMNF